MRHDPAVTGCRIREFARWDRTLLQHEREHLSRTMASMGAFVNKNDIMHDLSDLDYCLAKLPPENNPSPGDLT